MGTPGEATARVAAPPRVVTPIREVKVAREAAAVLEELRVEVKGGTAETPVPPVPGVARRQRSEALPTSSTTTTLVPVPRLVSETVNKSRADQELLVVAVAQVWLEKVAAVAKEGAVGTQDRAGAEDPASVGARPVVNPAKEEPTTAMEEQEAKVAPSNLRYLPFRAEAYSIYSTATSMSTTYTPAM